jgi:hypothetical protein
LPGVVIFSLAAQVSERFLRGEGAAAVQPAGCIAIYQALPDDRGYLRSADWTAGPRTWP